MHNVALKQRIKYLVEHGGLYPAPKWMLAVAVATAVNTAMLTILWCRFA